MKDPNEIRLADLSNQSRMMGESRSPSTNPLGEANGTFTPTDSIHGLIDLAKKVNIEDKVIAEVGCYLGVSTETFLLHKPKKMYAIDPWGVDLNYDESDGYLPDGGWGEIEQKFKERVGPYEEYTIIEIIKNTSIEAAKGFEENSLDFLYIDGNHEHSHVSADIEAWWPKIKRGGYMGGHDFYVHTHPPEYTGVEATVYHYFGHEGHLNNHVESFSDSSWLFKKL